jgi:hypothetical protein
MSCLPGTPCYTSTINTTGGLTGGCNLDPCVTTKLGTDAVFYTGPNLPCSGINPCDSVTLALQKMDAVVCNPPALSVTADNGLTKTANNIQLGGSLIQQTVITTSSAYTFSLLGLVADTNPAYILSQTSSGVTRITTIASIASIIGIITANNGLTKTGNNIQLGGALVTPTTVTTGSTNTLTLAGLQTDANPDFIVTETTGGVVRRISTTALATLIVPPAPATITADNGLTKTVNNIQLGGPLIKNTSVDLAGFNITLSDSSVTKVSTITLEARNLDTYFEYMQLGDNTLPTQKYGMAIGKNNTLSGTGFYGFIAGNSNVISAGSNSYAIGETNQVTTGGSGALGITNIVNGYHCHSIGYDLEVPAGNTGTLQAGQFNNVDAIDYKFEFADTSYPVFSVGNGTQSGITPAERLNAFHVMKSGFIKSRDGHDARAGQRGILPPQWSESGWIDTGGQTFDEGAKYIIIQFETGDDFSNLVDRVLWGESNTTGFTFIAGPGATPTAWTNLSEVIKVGRPISPEPGEMGYNLDAAQMEYWNGSTWIQF